MSVEVAPKRGEGTVLLSGQELSSQHRAGGGGCGRSHPIAWRMYVCDSVADVRCACAESFSHAGVCVCVMELCLTPVAVNQSC